MMKIWKNHAERLPTNCQCPFFAFQWQGEIKVPEKKGGCFEDSLCNNICSLV